MVDPTEPNDVRSARAALARTNCARGAGVWDCERANDGSVCGECARGRHVRIVLAHLATVTRERDEARETAVELHRRLTTRPLAVCAYCAEPMPEPDGFDGTTAARVAWMDAHMRACPEHPMSAVIRERDEARAALLNERGEGAPPSEGWTWRPRGERVGEWEHKSGAYAAFVHGQRHNGQFFAEWRLAHVPNEVERGGHVTAREAMRAADTALAGAKS